VGRKILKMQATETEPAHVKRIKKLIAMVEDSGLDAVATSHESSAPAVSVRNAELAAAPVRDAGDDVADALDRYLGRASTQAVATQGVPVSTRAPATSAPARDKGDDVADALDRMLGRTGGQS
jgi:hypothetical protein